MLRRVLTVCLAAGLMLSCGFRLRAAEIHDAVRAGNVQKVLEILDADPTLLNASDIKGLARTPLHWAAYYGSAEIARLLLDRGADVNGDKRRMPTPLELAAARGHKDVAELLIAHRAEVTMCVAAGLGQLDKVMALLDAAPESVNKRDWFHTSALIWAAFWGHKDVVELLLLKGAKEEGQYTYTALHAAAENGQKEVVDLLIAKGESSNASHYQGSLSDSVDATWTLVLVDYRRPKEGYGVRPIHLAVQNGHRAVVESLIAGGADIEVRDLGGRTPLLVAAEKGKMEIVEFLLAKGADIHAKNNDGKTVLQMAIENKHDDVAEVLRKAGAKE